MGFEPVAFPITPADSAAVTRREPRIWNLKSGVLRPGFDPTQNLVREIPVRQPDRATAVGGSAEGGEV